jgi:hypothetical protein
MIKKSNIIVKRRQEINERKRINALDPNVCFLFAENGKQFLYAANKTSKTWTE